MHKHHPVHFICIDIDLFGLLKGVCYYAQYVTLHLHIKL